MLLSQIDNPLTGIGPSSTAAPTPSAAGEVLQPVPGVLLCHSISCNVDAWKPLKQLTTTQTSHTQHRGPCVHLPFICIGVVAP